MTDTTSVVDAIRTGKPVILPTDTVYGLCSTPYSEAAVRRVYAVKSRHEDKPTTLLARDVDFLLECVPELRGRAATLARALLPGPLTLVLPNPARRFRWLSRTRPDTIGVRVPDVSGSVREVLENVGAVAATSANAAGGASPCRLDEVPQEIRAAVAAELVARARALEVVVARVALEVAVRERCGADDRHSENIVLVTEDVDLTGQEPVVLREGAVPADEALDRVRAAVA
jgi:L-threonylcarbamoyladenylate synthase